LGWGGAQTQEPPNPKPPHKKKKKKGKKTQRVSFPNIPYKAFTMMGGGEKRPLAIKKYSS